MTKQQENEQVPGMREQRFGIEIELTGLTRRAAADIIGDYMGTTPVYIGGFYYVYEIPDREGRQWRVVLDNSIFLFLKISRPREGVLTCFASFSLKKKKKNNDIRPLRMTL